MLCKQYLLSVYPIDGEGTCPAHVQSAVYIFYVEISTQSTYTCPKKWCSRHQSIGVGPIVILFSARMFSIIVVAKLRISSHFEFQNEQKGSFSSPCLSLLLVLFLFCIRNLSNHDIWSSTQHTMESSETYACKISHGIWCGVVGY